MTEILLAEALKIDCESEVNQISHSIREVMRKFKRRGVIVALSGGVDSSVVGALCVRALGPERVLGLLMPERDSSSETLQLSNLIGEHLGIELVEQDITDILTELGCYRYRDEAIKSMIPEYEPDFRLKIVLPNLIDNEQYRFFSVVVQSPDGREFKARMMPEAYLQVVAATNFKQRTRKMLEYFHGDRKNYAITGTPNRLEYDQGFFVKLGDGSADLKPIAHLYKTQVYQLAEYLDIPAQIRKRPPTTDTYSLAQTQEEFYFSLPYNKMDSCLYGINNGLAPETISASIGLTAAQVQRVYDDILSKRVATRYLHALPILVEDVVEVSPP